MAIGSRWSKPLAIAMILLGFMLAFVPATPIMLLGGGISTLGQIVAAALIDAGAPAVLANLLWGVVANSLCFAVMMTGYVFGINLVFLAYEEWGYMARRSYVFDETMARLACRESRSCRFSCALDAPWAAFLVRASSIRGGSACLP